MIHGCWHGTFDKMAVLVKTKPSLCEYVCCLYKKKCMSVTMVTVLTAIVLYSHQREISFCLQNGSTFR